MKLWQSLSFVAPADLPLVAQLVESSGYYGAAVSDHVAFPPEIASPYPYSADGVLRLGRPPVYPGPFEAIAAMSAVTSSLHFTTAVCIIPVRQPVLLAKSVTTIAALSGGRFSLGCGVGWMREEFQAVGQDFRSRGLRTDEILAAVRELSTGTTVTHQSRHYEFGPIAINPVPPTSIPMWIGGQSTAALRRACQWDGWISAPGGRAELEAAAEVFSAVQRAEGPLPPNFERMAIWPKARSAPLEEFRRLQDAGFTSVLVPSISAPSGVEDIRRDISSFADRVISKL